MQVQKGRAPPAAFPGCLSVVLCPTLAAAPAWPQGPVPPVPGRCWSLCAPARHDGRDRAACAPVPGPARPGPGPAEQLCHARPRASLWLPCWGSGLSRNSLFFCSSALAAWVLPPSLFGAGQCVLPSAQGSELCPGRALHQGSAALALIRR